MTENAIVPDMDQAITLAIVELLLKPDFSAEWLQDFIEQSIQKNATEAELSYTENTIRSTLDQLAIPFVDSLPEELTVAYRAMLEKRAGVHSLK